MNDKMWGVFNAIETSVIHNLPVGYQLTVFSGKIKLRDIIIQAMLDCCEYAYGQTADKKSLRAHRKKDDNNDYEAGDAAKGQLQRTATELNDKNQVLSKYIRDNYEIEIKTPAFEKDFLSKRNRQPYSINDEELKELKIYKDIKMFDVLLKKQFLSKDFLNSQFRACSEEYDRVVSNVIKEINEESDVILNTLLLYTIEWQYYFDFAYELAVSMEKHGFREIPDMYDRLTAFLYQPTITTALKYFNYNCPATVTVMSRAVKIRRLFTDEIVTMHPGPDYELIQAQFLEAIYLINILPISIEYEGKVLRDWFVENTDIEDWTSVCSEYKIGDVFIAEKNWTNKRIRYIKNIYKEMFFDYPKSR